MLVSIQTVDMYWFTSVTYGQNFVAVRYHMVSGELTWYGPLEISKCVEREK